MKNQLEYSGLNTKIKAMQAKLLKSNDYMGLSECTGIKEAISVLANSPAYQKTFSGSHTDNLHREDIERLLMQNKYDDFTKIYRFSNPMQRNVLALFFLHYEIALLKKLLRSCISHSKSAFRFQDLKDFYLKHSHLDFERLLAAKNMQEFTEGLSGSFYEKSMKDLLAKNANLFAYESMLDQLYFRRIWMEKEALHKSDDIHILTEIVGSKIDLLNVVWIYRAKKYYQMSFAQMQSLVIPIFHHLKKETIDKLIFSKTLDEFEQVFRTSYYKKNMDTEVSEFRPDDVYAKKMDDVYRKLQKQNPNSIATAAFYLYQKELEIETLISMIESIRYGRSASTIQEMIRSKVEGRFQT